MKSKLSNAAFGQAKEIMEQTKQAQEDGQIDADEKKERLETAKSVISDK